MFQFEPIKITKIISIIKLISILTIIILYLDIKALYSFILIEMLY